MKFEYKTRYFSDHDMPQHKWNEWFNEMGQDGWELMNIKSERFIDNNPGYANHFFIWKRQIK